ncbi:heat shock factor protein 5 [Mixophyes fleayi]|uniref:heat shock factor protein 5 n=1 Tax=Mixophyes fleayi TaxID=3061075 RepID=UPI003F4DB75A
MDVEESLLSTPINPNNFPAKLWRLVNSPHYQSICWDSRGEGVIIDQQLFESELLSPPKAVNEAIELFKTSNFTSFIRQLNLYGFRKVVMGSDGSPSHHHPGGDLGVGDGHLHHFYNVHFRKENPDLLVNLKRLTSTNKAKMAAGLAVNSRPPNRFQRLLNNSLAEQSKGENQGPMSIEQIHRAFRRENFSPYHYVNPASHSHIAFPLNEFHRTPNPQRTWPNSLGRFQGQLDPPSSFPQKGIIFPVLQRFPTDVTYTLQPGATSLHVQQGHSGMSGVVQQYSSYVPPTAQYARAYYPPALLQCCSPPAHMDHLTGCSSPAVSSYQHCSYFQNPLPMQSPFPMEFFHANWPSSDSDEFKKDEVNLEDVFQFVDELQSSPQLEIVKLDEEEDPVQPSSPPLKNQNAAGTLFSGNDGSSYSSYSHENHLESLVSVNTDSTTYAPLASDQSVACHMPQTSNYDYPPHNNHSIVDLNTSSDKTLAVEEMELLVCDVPSVIKLAKDEDVIETRGMSIVDKSPDLTLLVDVACKQEQFVKEEELGE